MSLDGTLWTPDNGWTTTREREAANALAEYDPDLLLGYNQDNGDWVVYVKNGPHSGQPFPVFGLGRELPAADEIKRRLYESDVRRHGAKIIQQITKRGERRKLEERKAADDATGIAAEALDWATRKEGGLPQRIFVGKSIPTELKGMRP